jgi:hypothetical protein
VDVGPVIEANTGSRKRARSEKVEESNCAPGKASQKRQRVVTTTKNLKIQNQKPKLRELRIFDTSLTDTDRVISSGNTINEI